MKSLYVTGTLIIFILLAGYIALKNENIREAYYAEVESRNSYVRSLLDENEFDFTVGSNDPSVRLIVYTDTECPSCREFEGTLAMLRAEYPDEVAITYRHHQTTSYPQSRYERPALECVGIIGGDESFRAFHEILLQKTYSEGESFDEAVRFLGEDNRVILQECIENPKTKERIDEKLAAAKTLGIPVTPSWYALGSSDTQPRLYAGRYEFMHLREIVEGEMKRK